jgi:hypothetical protein
MSALPRIEDAEERRREWKAGVQTVQALLFQFSKRQLKAEPFNYTDRLKIWTVFLVGGSGPTGFRGGQRGIKPAFNRRSA